MAKRIMVVTEEQIGDLEINTNSTLKTLENAGKVIVDVHPAVGIKNSQTVYMAMIIYETRIIN